MCCIWSMWARVHTYKLYHDTIEYVIITYMSLSCMHSLQSRSCHQCCEFPVRAVVVCCLCRTSPIFTDWNLRSVGTSVQDWRNIWICCILDLFYSIYYSMISTVLTYNSYGIHSMLSLLAFESSTCIV